jgi:hypothetical protein
MCGHAIAHPLFPAIHHSGCCPGHGKCNPDLQEKVYYFVKYQCEDCAKKGQNQKGLRGGSRLYMPPPPSAPIGSLSDIKDASNAGSLECKSYQAPTIPEKMEDLDIASIGGLVHIDQQSSNISKKVDALEKMTAKKRVLIKEVETSVRAMKESFLKEAKNNLVGKDWEIVSTDFDDEDWEVL